MKNSIARILPSLTLLSLVGRLHADDDSSSVALPLTTVAGRSRYISEQGGLPPTTVTARSRYIGETEFGNTGTKVSIVSGGLVADIPFPIVGALSGSLGVSGDYFSFDFRNFSAFVPHTDTPIKQGYEARVNPGLHYHYSDDWSFFAGAQWQADSADGASVGRSTMWGGSAGAVYRVNSEVTLSFGFAGATRLGYATAYAPFVGVHWQINEHWLLSVTGDRTDYVAPVLRIAYQLDPRWTFFAQGGYETRYIRLDRDSTIPDGTLRYRAGSAQIGVDHRLNRWLAVTVYGGAQIAQDYKFQTSSIGLVGKHEAGTSPSVGVRINASF